MTGKTLPDGMPTVDHTNERLSAALPTDGTQVELAAVWQRLDLTRFSGGRVHQNVGDWSPRVWARAWTSGGPGYAIRSSLDPESLSSAVAEATANANHVQGNRIDLPTSAEINNTPFFESTANLTSATRQEIASMVIETGEGKAVAHGNIRVALQTHALVNSSGLRTGFEASYVAMNLVSQAAGRATGYAGAIGRNAAKLDLGQAAQRATDIAIQGEAPVVVPPGDYEILIDPPAMSMLLVSLGYVGLNLFGANAAKQSSSWHHVGRKTASAAFTLIDDPLDEDALFSPIDAEGTERNPITLIDSGSVVGAAHDLATAKRDDVSSTGHALPAGDKGPAPHSLSIPAGSTSRADLISGMKRGLIVNRIHPFVSLRGGPAGELSGTTRDGVFLVENGEIVAPVANVRWSNSMTDLFGNVEAASKERHVEFMDLPEFSPHTAHVPSVYSTRFTVQSTQPRER